MTFSRIELEQDKERYALLQAEDRALFQRALQFVIDSDRYNYAYQWTWCGLPILQLPQDVLMTQEIISKCRPTVLIETGVAWGGGIALYASTMDVYGGRLIIGVDTNLAPSVVKAVEDIGFDTPIELIKGSSTDEKVVSHIRSRISEDDRVMIVLDSNHTYQHVLEELRMYAPLVTPGLYCIVSATVLEIIPEQSHRPRPWGHGNNPMTAVSQFLEDNEEFRSDQSIDDRLVMSYNPQGYLQRLASPR